MTIFIKPENRGKSRAAAKRGGFRTTLAWARNALANKGKHSAAILKRAQFVVNSSKWKKG